jgi:hypothetical protein
VRIVVTHLTRMKPGTICVAGRDRATGRDVRPIIPFDHLSTDLLVRNGGPFDISRQLDLGQVRHKPDPPHVEDHVFEPARVRQMEKLTGREFWGLLQSRAQTSLRAIFGADLKQIGRARCGIEVGCGTLSLGYLIPREPPQLRFDEKGRLRADVADGEFTADASVTDIRLYQDDHQTPDRQKVEKLNALLSDSSGIVLSMGLTRPYAPDFSQMPISYLQLNNLHLREFPLWQLR